ncbi:MAG: DUF1838 family protein [Rhodospirillaceae bacterium]|nr:DUF1838 family protein [Rhodospirillaceae bacterium]
MTKTTDRRMALGAGATAGFAAMTSAFARPVQAAVKKIEGASLKGPYLDLTTPYGNVEGYARLTSNTDMKSAHFGWFEGIVMGVVDNGPIVNLFGFRGFGCTRLLPLEGEHGYRRLLREVGYYTDLATGKIMEEMVNPFTNEKVRVVPVTNDPFNRVISEYELSRPTFGGLNQEKPAEKKGFQLNWTINGDRLMMERHIHLYYKNALDPKTWPRESSGEMVRASEFYLYNMALDDMQNKDLTAFPHTGYWGRVTPWLPWMLMGRTPGHCLYQCYTGSAHGLEDLPQDLVEYTAKHYPKYLDAPTTWEEPSLSSLEVYARTQKPAPAPGGV